MRQRWLAGFVFFLSAMLLSLPCKAGNQIQQSPAIDSNSSNKTRSTVKAASPNHPPKLNPLESPSVNEGQKLVIRLSATDPDNDTLTYSARNMPYGATLDSRTGVFSWTPQYDDAGMYYVVFMVTDKGSPPMSDFQRTSIMVYETNRSPSLYHIGPRVVTEGNKLTIKLVAMDPDGDRLTFKASGMPRGARLIDHGDGTATFEWVPRHRDAGLHTILFTVSEVATSVNSAFEKVTIKVRSRSRAGQIPGDLNHDRVVDMKDYDLFQKALGLCNNQKGFNEEADYDNDDCITVRDYQKWMEYYTNRKRGK